MPEIIQHLDSISIDLDEEGFLHLESEDHCSGNANNSHIIVPPYLISYFLEKLIEIAGKKEEVKK